MAQEGPYTTRTFLDRIAALERRIHQLEACTGTALAGTDQSIQGCHDRLDNVLDAGANAPFAKSGTPSNDDDEFNDGSLGAEWTKSLSGVTYEAEGGYLASHWAALMQTASAQASIYKAINYPTGNTVKVSALFHFFPNEIGTNVQIRVYNSALTTGISMSAGIASDPAGLYYVQARQMYESTWSTIFTWFPPGFHTVAAFELVRSNTGFWGLSWSPDGFSTLTGYRDIFNFGLARVRLYLIQGPTIAAHNIQGVDWVRFRTY